MNRIKLFALGAAMALPAAGVMFASAAPTNLIANGTFDSSVAGWDNYGGNPQFYYKTMKVTNADKGTGNSYRGAWYCVKVKPGAEYVTEADYFVPASAPEDSGASLQLHYYGTDDCSGGNIANGPYRGSGKLPAQRDDWFHFEFKDTAPDGAHSARVRVSAIKEPSGGGAIPADHVVYFDNISFVQQLKLVLPTSTATPKGPGGIIVKPTPTQTPKGPDDLVANPDPTQPPVGPGDLTANPDPTEPPSGPDDLAPNPQSQPTATPGAPDTGDSTPGDQPSDGGDANSSDGGGSVPQGQAGSSTSGHDGSGAAGGNTDLQPLAQENGGSVGLGLGLLFLGAGGVCTAVGLFFAALARRRRRDA